MDVAQGKRGQVKNRKSARAKPEGLSCSISPSFQKRSKSILLILTVATFVHSVCTSYTDRHTLINSPLNTLKRLQNHLWRAPDSPPRSPNYPLTKRSGASSGKYRWYVLFLRQFYDFFLPNFLIFRHSSAPKASQNALILLVFRSKCYIFLVFCQLSLIFANCNAKNFSPGISYKTIAIMTLRVYNKV